MGIAAHDLRSPLQGIRGYAEMIGERVYVPFAPFPAFALAPFVALVGPEVAAFWIDPISGDAWPVGTFSNKGVQSFSTPDGWEDAILVLEAAK